MAAPVGGSSSSRAGRRRGLVKSLSERLGARVENLERRCDLLEGVFVFIDIDAVNEKLRMVAQKTTEHFYIGDGEEGMEADKEEDENIDEEPEIHLLPKVPEFPFDAEGEDEGEDEVWHDIPIVEKVGGEHEETESADDAASEAEVEAVSAPQEEPVWLRAWLDGFDSALERAFPPQQQCFWDPMGLTKDSDIVGACLTRHRAREINNGRVTMLVQIAPAVPNYFKLPEALATAGNLKSHCPSTLEITGALTCADVPNGFAAPNVVQLEVWLLWLALCGSCEIGINGESQPGHMRPLCGNRAPRSKACEHPVISTGEVKLCDFGWACMALDDDRRHIPRLWRSCVR